jgi:cell division protein FtsI (penicillin-binding protein 3)
MQINSFYSKPRLVFLLLLAVAFAFYVVVVYGTLAFMREKPPVQPPPQVTRGYILDRNGKPLAVQTYFYHFAATPSNVSEERLALAASLFEPVTGIGASATEELIRTARSNFVYLKKKITEADYEALRRIIDENKLEGFYFDRIPGRFYPENALASALIGYMGDDGDGLSGIEYSMQETLAPRLSTDPASSVNGNNVYLTIDADLQYKLERIAAAAMDSTQAESVMMLAADALTGEILSYISLPSANLNTYPSSTIQEKIDRPALTAYEPGSVFKVFSVATFLDRGVIGEADTFFCGGVYELKSGNETIRITCLDRHGYVTARDALKYSCNVALAQMSEKIDAERFLAALGQLGFGKKTGIELPSETAGSVKTTGDRLWSARSKPTMSFGQELSVSALQVVEAATAIANDGVPLKLTVVSRVADREGREIFSHAPKPLPRVFSQRTARNVLSYMKTTAESGTGSRARLPDISIGVKTGTAQMRDIELGGYSETDFISNCVAVFPVESPKVVLYLVITKAQGETLAGRIAAPVVADAANVIIDHMGLSRTGAPSYPHPGTYTVERAPDIVIGEVMPDLRGTPKRALTHLLARADIAIRITGDGWVSAQTPPPGSPVTRNMKIELFLE